MKREELIEVIADTIDPHVSTSYKASLNAAQDVLTAIEAAGMDRNTALEDAAKVADARDLSIMSSTAFDIEARKIAAAIRAMKTDE